MLKIKKSVTYTLYLSLLTYASLSFSNQSAPPELEMNFKLNPLPDSVSLNSSAFEATSIGILDYMGNLPVDSNILYGATGDINNNGEPEIYLGGWGWMAGLDGTATPETEPKKALIGIEFNETGAHILNLDAQFGVSSHQGTTFLRIEDFDLNGDLDLLIGAHNEWPFTPYQNRVLLNNNGSYTENLFGPKVAMHEGEVGDFNNDGYPDFIGSAYITNWVDVVGNDVLPDDHKNLNSALFLYLNDTKGNFKAYALNFNYDLENAPETRQEATAEWTEEQVAKNGNNGFIGTGSAADIGNLDNDPEMEVVVVDVDSFTFQSTDHNYIIDNIKLGDNYAHGEFYPLPEPYMQSSDVFKQVRTSTGETTASHDVNVKIIDFDNDGLNDIVVNSVWMPTNGGEDIKSGIVQFLKNKGNLVFEDVTDTTLYNRSYSVWGSHEPSWIDFNNDGFLDLYNADVAPNYQTDDGGNGSLYLPIPDGYANEILINTGNGKFVSTMRKQFLDLYPRINDILTENGVNSFTGPSNFVRMQNALQHYKLKNGTYGFLSITNLAPNEPVSEGPAETQALLIDIRAKQQFYTGPNGSNSALRGEPGFSEYFYLTENPDVVTSINAGTHADGLDHYIAIGKGEGRAAFAKNSIVHGSNNNDIILLREGTENAFGYAGNDSFDGHLGDDILDGGDGKDSALYTNELRDFTLTKVDNGFLLTNQDSSINHHLINIEKLIFAGAEYTFSPAETDADADGMSDEYELANSLNSNDVSDANSDNDEDGLNNLTESLMGTSGSNADSDNDGANDNVDLYPLDANKASDIDTDGDGIDDAIDNDDDGDDVLDTADAFPLDASESIDTDGDGIGNNADSDDDGDSVIDTEDAFPLDTSESIDTDGDGTGNNADTDDDGDGVSDVNDAYPLDSSKSTAPEQVKVSNNSSGGGASSFSLWLLLVVIAARRIQKPFTF